MNNKLLISLFSVLFGAVIVLGVLLYRTQSSLTETQRTLSAEIDTSKQTDVKLFGNYEQNLAKINAMAEQVSVLDESISPADKRWAKVKKVRKAVQDTIKNEGYRGVPDINGLTSYASAVVDYSEQYDVPIPLILAITKRESAWNVHAESHAGAQGLMQLMPETAKECANDVNKPFYNVFKVRDNVQLGTWYLWKMLNIFNGDVELAIRAYNAGPVYVKKVLNHEEGFEDYPSETRKYHSVVLKWKKEYEDLGL